MAESTQDLQDVLQSTDEQVGYVHGTDGEISHILVYAPSRTRNRFVLRPANGGRSVPLNKTQTRDRYLAGDFTFVDEDGSRFKEICEMEGIPLAAGRSFASASNSSRRRSEVPDNVTVDMLDSLNVGQLRRVAAGTGIKEYGKLNKASLLAALREVMSSAGPSDEDKVGEEPAKDVTSPVVEKDEGIADATVTTNDDDALVAEPLDILDKIEASNALNQEDEDQWSEEDLDAAFAKADDMLPKEFSAPKFDDEPTDSESDTDNSPGVSALASGLGAMGSFLSETESSIEELFSDDDATEKTEVASANDDVSVHEFDVPNSVDTIFPGIGDVADEQSTLAENLGTDSLGEDVAVAPADFDFASVFDDAETEHQEPASEDGKSDAVPSYGLDSSHIEEHYGIMFNIGGHDTVESSPAEEDAPENEDDALITIQDDEDDVVEVTPSTTADEVASAFGFEIPDFGTTVPDLGTASADKDATDSNELGWSDYEPAEQETFEKTVTDFDEMTDEDHISVADDPILPDVIEAVVEEKHDVSEALQHESNDIMFNLTGHMPKHEDDSFESFIFDDAEETETDFSIEDPFAQAVSQAEHVVATMPTGDDEPEPLFDDRLEESADEMLGYVESVEDQLTDSADIAHRKVGNDIFTVFDTDMDIPDDSAFDAPETVSDTDGTIFWDSSQGQQTPEFEAIPEETVKLGPTYADIEALSLDEDNSDLEDVNDAELLMSEVVSVMDDDEVAEETNPYQIIDDVVPTIPFDTTDEFQAWDESYQQHVTDTWHADGSGKDDAIVIDDATASEPPLTDPVAAATYDIPQEDYESHGMRGVSPEDRTKMKQAYTRFLLTLGLLLLLAVAALAFMLMTAS